MAALAALAAAVFAVAVVVRSRATARRRWLATCRDLAAGAERAASTTDTAAPALTGPAAVDRQTWLEAGEALQALVASAAALAADAATPDDPSGADGLTSTLDRLRSDLTVCRSAVDDAGRTRFELVGPTDEQLAYASQTVRQGCAAVIASAHALSAAVDRVDPDGAAVVDSSTSGT